MRLKKGGTFSKRGTFSNIISVLVEKDKSTKNTHGRPLVVLLINVQHPRCLNLAMPV